MKSLYSCWLLPALAFTLPQCARRAGPPPAMPPPLVSVARPDVATVTGWDEFPAHIESVESVEIRPRVAGYIDSIHFEDGAMVDKGALLFVIDPKPYQAEFDRAVAERKRAEVRLELAKNELGRAEALRGTRAISEEEYDARNKAVREVEAALNAARAGEAAAKLNLDYTRITAPIGGRLGRRLVTAGNLVQGGGMVPGTVLVTIVTTDPIYAYFDADERAFFKYRKAGAAPGDPGRKGAALPCELGLDGEDGFPHKGRVDFHDNRVDPVTATLRMRAVLENRDGALVPGAFARVRLPVERMESALLIPESAIGSEQTLKFVFVINAEQAVEARPVRLGRQEGTRRVVLSGLKPDDRVVVQGVMMLRPGVKVRVQEGGAPVARAAS